MHALRQFCILIVLSYSVIPNASWAESTAFGVNPPSFHLSGLPGEVITAKLKIENSMSTESIYALKVKGAIAKPAGVVDVPMSSLPADHIARNLNLESTALTVPSKSYKEVSFTIRIPESAKGTQYAGIAISRTGGGKKTTERSGEYQREVSLGMQPGIGVTIQVAIKGTVKYACKINSVRTSRPSANRPPIITVSLQNSGNGELRVNPILALVDSAGKAGSRLKSKSTVSISPGASANVEFETDGRDIPAGSYKGILSIGDSQYNIAPIETTVSVK